MARMEVEALVVVAAVFCKGSFAASMVVVAARA